MFSALAINNTTGFPTNPQSGQVYNAGLDQTTLRPSIDVDYIAASRIPATARRFANKLVARRRTQVLISIKSSLPGQQSFVTAPAFSHVKDRSMPDRGTMKTFFDLDATQ